MTSIAKVIPKLKLSTLRSNTKRNNEHNSENKKEQNKRRLPAAIIRRVEVKGGRHDYQEKNLLQALKADADVVWKTQCLTHANEPSHSFDLGKKLGHGSFGTVFVLKKNFNRCLKLIECSASVNIEKEMISCALHAEVSYNPWIVSIYEYGLIKNRKARYGLVDKTYCAYNVMELCRGGELFDAIAAKEYKDAKVANTTCLRLIDALCTLEEKQIVHCDIKPENIMLATGFPHVKDLASVRIVDFGGAVEEGSVTGTSTLAYRSPEQIQKPHIVTCKSDVFSMGLVIAMLLFYGQSSWFATAIPGIKFFGDWQNAATSEAYMSAREKWLNVILEHESTPIALKKMLISDHNTRPNASEIRNEKFFFIDPAPSPAKLTALMNEWDNKQLREWIKDKLIASTWQKLENPQINGRLFLNRERFASTNMNRYGFNKREIDEIIKIRNKYT